MFNQYQRRLNYIGGSRDVSLGDLSEEEIVAEVDKGCRQVLLNEAAPPPKVRLHLFRQDDPGKHDETSCC